MNLDEYVSNLITNYSNNRNCKFLRNDYHKLESEKPIMFKGYGDKSGICYIVDRSYDTYINIHILENRIKLIFRKDDNNIIKITINDNYETFLETFLIMVDEYQEFKSNCILFSNGNIPKYLLRENKINKILS